MNLLSSKSAAFKVTGSHELKLSGSNKDYPYRIKPKYDAFLQKEGEYLPTISYQK